MCVSKECDGKVTGKFKKIVPLCPSCRYLAKWVFGTTVSLCGVVCGFVLFVVKNAEQIMAIVRRK